MASVRVVTLHKLFLYSDPPLPCHPPSYWPRLFSSHTSSRTNTPTFSNLVILHIYPPMKMGQSVPKRRHTKFRRRGITQRKAYNHVKTSHKYFWIYLSLNKLSKSEIENFSNNKAIFVYYTSSLTQLYYLL